MHVLVTGSSGAIGRPVCAELALHGDIVRGFDRERADAPNELYLGDIENANQVRQAMRGMEVVIHLAANPYDAPFPDLIGPNVLGLYNVLDAARSEGVRRVILASSVQVVGRGSDRRLTADHRKPNNHYAVTKVLCEDMGAMYAERFGIEVIAARVGWMVRDAREAKRMQELKLFHIYVSQADISRFFSAATHAELSERFAVLWAIGVGGRDRFDLETARRVIGYEPRDTWPSGLSPQLQAALST